jgi:dTMP kinase
MSGLFVTFEGGDGSGKSTQLARIAARLERAGIAPVVTREPGGTPLAEGIRKLLLNPAGRPDALTEAFLIEAARTDLMAQVISPALAAGHVILCDRHADSTLAYQGYGRGLDLDALRAWNEAATGGRVPDLTLFFDLDPGIGLARREAARGESNRIDREPLEFHARVRQGFLEIARSAPERVMVLDAALDPDEIEARAWSVVAERLGSRGLIAGH